MLNTEGKMVGPAQLAGLQSYHPLTKPMDYQAGKPGVLPVIMHNKI